MYRRITRKIQEMPPRFFVIAGIALVVSITAISLFIPPVDDKVDSQTSGDYKAILNQYSNCSACTEFTGEKPTFTKVSSPSPDDYSIQDSYRIDVIGNGNHATIDAELRKGINRIELIE